MTTAAKRQLILVLGGARSGKSAFGERLAATMAEPVTYIATATAGDDEMRRRIAAHQQARPASWQTIEEPVDLADALRQAQRAQTILLDCLTLWISNVLLTASPLPYEGEPASDERENAKAAEEAVGRRLDDLLGAYDAGDANLIAVSNEVGLGLVPPYPLGRLYRDLLGRVNQRLAARADAVYLMIAGLPVDIKALSAR